MSLPCLRCPQLLFFSLIMLMSTVLRGQMPDIAAELSWGSEQKAPAGSRLAKVIHAGRWGACLFRYKPATGFGQDQYWLEYYDARFTFQGRFELDIPHKPRADVEDIIVQNQQLYLLLSRPLPQEDISQLILRPLTRSGQVTGKTRVLAEIPLAEKYRRRLYDLTHSRDSSHLLIYNQQRFQAGGKERFSLRVYDGDFKLQWSLDEQLDYPDEGFNVIEYQVDRQGDVYLLGSFREIADERSLPPVHSLFAYRNNGREVTEYPLQIAGVHLRQMTCQLDQNGELVCAGFYVPHGAKSAAGLCQVRVNLVQKTTVSTQLVPFEQPEQL
ncbi:MAG: hypothetical protein AAGJ82_12230, partial [Bacteroidota bacterium]